MQCNVVEPHIVIAGWTVTDASTYKSGDRLNSEGGQFGCWWESAVHYSAHSSNGFQDPCILYTWVLFHFSINTGLQVSDKADCSVLTLEMESRTFREMRDAALADAEGARAELRNNKSAYEELFSK